MLDYIKRCRGMKMSNQNKTDKQYEEDRRAKEADPNYAICLHCNNPFHLSDGVVTTDAALCDVCNGR